MIVILIVLGLVFILFGVWVLSVLKLNKELEDYKEE